jgi:hypothetical protein
MDEVGVMLLAEHAGHQLHPRHLIRAGAPAVPGLLLRSQCLSTGQGLRTAAGAGR